MTENKIKQNKELLVALSVLLAVALFVMLINPVLIPKRSDYGSTWGPYLKEEKNTIDVLFFGSSITYCDVVPAAIWESSGISSYLMAGPEQTLPISYYYLKESIKTQTPKAVFVEVTGAFFERYQSYTKVNVGYMPTGVNRLAATFYASERSQWAGLLFPPYNYHSRWDQLTHEDFEIAINGYTADTLAGYTFLNTATPITAAQPRGEKYDAENYKRNIEYLRKIASFCVERDIIPVFYIAPTCWPLSPEHRDMLEGDASAIDGAVFIDFNYDEKLPELSPETDYYDLLHFNCYGAEKFSSYLGEVMKEKLDLPPSQKADPALWQTRIDYFHQLANPV